MLTLSLVALLGLLALGPAAIPLRRLLGDVRATQLVYGGALVLCAALAAAALSFLAAGGEAERMELPIGLPWAATRLRLDGLAAFVLALVGGLGALAALYGLGYGRHEPEPGRVLPFFPVFLAGMGLVPLADDAFAFLVAWEFMSLSSWLLVLAAHREDESRRAAFVYIVMAAFGTAALLLAFGILAGTAGDYGFEAIRHTSRSAATASIVLLLVLLGAGSKAGLVPLHVWLPLAHPAAPSHVSALMSGVMTKVALYAIIRVLFDLMGRVEWWWGVVLLLVGAATALLGVLWAVIERDLKTLLAYSTVENIGIITIGIGLAVSFQATGFKPLASLALVAALFHAANHATFKSLLFFGAGAVAVATGTRDLERLGGLIHRLPVTAVAFLIGCGAIAALPPLNGFASEWLLFQAVLEGVRLPEWGLKFAVPVVGAALALAAALAATAFVRAFGIAFLGRARSPEAAAAGEVAMTMRAAMIIPAAGCVLLGIFPVAAVGLIQPAVERLLEAPPGIAMPVLPGWLIPTVTPNAYMPLVLVLALVALGGVAHGVVRWLSPEAVRRVPPWDCGFPDPSPETQYTASSFAQPLRRVLGATVFVAREVVDMPTPGDTRPARFGVEITDRVWEALYAPLIRSVIWLTDRMNALQFLTIRQNLSMMFAALVLLLLLVAVLR
jgi:hydrogenase-4 component B